METRVHFFLFKGASIVQEARQHEHTNVVFNRTPEKIRRKRNLDFPLKDKDARELLLMTVTKVPDTEGAFSHYVNDNRDKAGKYYVVLILSVFLFIM